jgi:hypothetical protein
MRFKKWIPKDQDVFQPTLIRLYFDQNCWVGMKRVSRAPRGSYEDHRSTKGEVQFDKAVFQFGGFTQTQAEEILSELRSQRKAFLEKTGMSIEFQDLDVSECIEFAQSE